MIMGSQGQNGVRNYNHQECQEILDIYFEYGKQLDTARAYGEGTTEKASNLQLTELQSKVS